MELLLTEHDGEFEEDKSHYANIKTFNRFMYNQTKHKEKKHFCMSYL